MADTQESLAQKISKPTACDVCGHNLKKGWSFALKDPAADGAETVSMTHKCVGCAIQHRPMLRRSLTVALVVGTVLTVLNQGDIFFAGNWQDPLYWKIPLTYSVPFCVATYGALSNGRN